MVKFEGGTMAREDGHLDLKSRLARPYVVVHCAMQHVITSGVRGLLFPCGVWSCGATINLTRDTMAYGHMCMEDETTAKSTPHSTLDGIGYHGAHIRTKIDASCWGGRAWW